MIEKIITSKTRVKLLKLFLTHIDDRYYLRELERLLNESLSPLRRQLLKLENMEILRSEHEANLKYYRLNKNFAGIEDLKNLVLGSSETPQVILVPEVKQQVIPESKPQPQPVITAPRRMKLDLVVLVLVSLFVLGTSIFVVSMFEVRPRTQDVRGLTSNTRPDEMVSRRWKITAGSMPTLSSGIEEKI